METCKCPQVQGGLVFVACGAGEYGKQITSGGTCLSSGLSGRDRMVSGGSKENQGSDRMDGRRKDGYFLHAIDVLGLEIRRLELMGGRREKRIPAIMEVIKFLEDGVGWLEQNGKRGKVKVHTW